MPPFIASRFVDRPNRFLVRCRVGDDILQAHLPDPGRLKELLIPDAELWIEHTPVPHRKTRYTVHLVRSGRELVSINTSIPNKLVKLSLQNQCLPGFEDYTYIRAEVPMGRHRFDFELQSSSGRKVLMEVKSVTLNEDGHTVRFPDAVTSRGKSHVETLDELTGKDMECWILFIVQRSDARVFTPHWERDPVFSQALAGAEKRGVKIAVRTCRISQNCIQWGESIPYDLRDYRYA